MRSVILGFAVLLVGCPAKPVEVSPAIDAGPVAEPIDAGPIDAGPALLEPLVTAGLSDGGTLSLKVANEPIDPPAALTVALPTRLKDLRIRLLDWRDQLVVSDDELMPDGVTYVITLKDPLKTGRRYKLSLDAELGTVVTSESGQSMQDWELEFTVAGDVQPDPAALKKSSKKKKR